MGIHSKYIPGHWLLVSALAAPHSLDLLDNGRCSTCLGKESPCRSARADFSP